LGVVGIDSSGIIKDPTEAVWMAAVREIDKQKHNILFLSAVECEKYRRKIPENYWRERIAAALVFKSLEPLIRHFDIVQIHKDWPGHRADVVKRFLERLFGVRFCGRYPLSNVKIQLIPGEGTDEIQRADGKSWNARHGWRDHVFNCPDLSKLLEELK
jgi:hypothetical protein